MRNIMLVAKREYLEKIRSRAFRFSTIGVPVLIALIMVGSYMSGRSAGKIGDGKHFVISCDDQALAADMRTHLLEDKDAHFTIELADAAARQALTEKLRGKQIDGVLTIDLTAQGSPKAVYLTRSSGGLTNMHGFAAALSRSLAEEKLSANGMTAEQVQSYFQNVEIQEKEIDKSGRISGGRGMAAFNKAMFFVFLSTIPVLIYGMDMARSIIEEKSSRIFEVMLAVAKPEDLLAGKMLGAGAAGMTQVAIWVLVGVAISGSAMTSAMLSGDLSIHFGWAEAVFFPVFFVLGFLLYSALFSGLAATCETAQDLQMYSPLAVAPVWISMGVLPLLLTDPNSKAAVFASLFPFTSPFVMVARISLQTPPVWQIVSSIVLILATIRAVIWFSSRLYRVGILMYGKRATLPEIFRWLRYS